ncbi:uncharacterized protein LOC119279783 [Triticum dicoccoides]|uniref:uncharacterized protein LOC119279783 n=1 Tax=Triticum dicoccoides TaxID=85692 RepID=UPI00188F5E5C|nr:uncharacterized protein LOC119279783 [Triticum dicoccoides]XP_044346310.1 uncharacterized protein LOC123067678 [Triticum aestivum]
MTVAQRYALMKANVEGLKPLQVGIAVCDHQGQQVAWEFNLRDFCRLTDPHDQKVLMGSGLIGAGHMRPLSWITYVGAYYVAYQLKIVIGGMQY